MKRRWLQPAHPPDRALLDVAYDDLSASFPAFAACTREHFLQTLADVSMSWGRRLRLKACEPRRSLADQAKASGVFLFQNTALEVAKASACHFPTERESESDECEVESPADQV